MDVRRTLLAIVLSVLPFTNVLAIPYSFPLKLYEIALLLLIVTWLHDMRVPFPRYVVRVVWPVGVMLLIALATMLLRETFNPPTSPSTASRFGQFGDGLAKLAYVSLAALAFCAITTFSARHHAMASRAWLFGAVAAATYAWYLVAISAMGREGPLLPSVAPPQHVQFGNLTVFRSGTFEEGNFFGFYLVLSVAVAEMVARRRAALFLSATVFTTLSTISIASLAIFWSVVIWQRARTKRLPRRVALLLAGALLLSIIAAATLASPYGRTVIIGKMLSDEPGSRLDRLDMAVAGIRMFIDNPVFGVGLAQYGFQYPAYRLTDIFDQFRSGRVIPNNVYIELLAEQGVVGFALFSIFLLKIWRRSHGPLRAGLVAMGLNFLAFPSFSVLFIWAFLALVVGHARQISTSIETRMSAVTGSQPESVVTTT